MSKILFSSLGSVGLVKDVPAHRQPINVFSDVKNVLFEDGIVKKSFGSSRQVTTSVLPYYVQVCRSYNDNYVLYAGLAKVYAYSMNLAQGNITRAGADYTGNAYDRWNGCAINGIPILTNGVDVPQFWSPVDLSTKLADLTSWPSSTYCKVIKTYRGFLIAIDITKGSTRYGNMVKWSSLADSGTIPDSWDETDPTKEAGETSLSESSGVIVDGNTLKDAFIIYKEESTWIMRYIGGTFIFRFDPLFSSIGAMAVNCAQPFEPSSHFVLARDDIVVHNGVQAKSLLNRNLRKWLNAEIGSTASVFSYVVPFYNRGEMWACLPTEGAPAVNLAVIWNWKENTWTVRDLPYFRALYSAYPYRTTSGDSWELDFTTTWDGETEELWNDPAYIKVSNEVFAVEAETVTGTLVKLDETIYTESGMGSATYKSYVEKQDMIIAGIDRQGQVIMDENKVKMLVSVKPKVVSEADISLWVTVGTRMSLSDSIVWSTPQLFTSTTKEELYFWEVGRYISVRIGDDVVPGTSKWELHSFEMEIKTLGER